MTKRFFYSLIFLALCSTNLAHGFSNPFRYLTDEIRQQRREWIWNVFRAIIPEEERSEWREDSIEFEGLSAVKAEFITRGPSLCISYLERKRDTVRGFFENLIKEYVDDCKKNGEFIETKILKEDGNSLIASTLNEFTVKNQKVIIHSVEKVFYLGKGKYFLVNYISTERKLTDEEFSKFYTRLDQLTFKTKDGINYAKN